MPIKFDNTYIKLPESFYRKIPPTPVSAPQLECFNSGLNSELDLGWERLEKREIAEFLSGNKILEGSEPIALVYAGHQFGHFVPQLGDGRAILLGEFIDKKGTRKDLQLKGAGKTPFSRLGDGRAALGPMIREYVVSEAMHALNIKTTRSLAVVTTGEVVYREEVLPGAILTRVASSHIRIGTFEYFVYQKDLQSLKILADYTITRHYPEARETVNPYYSLLRSVRDNQISLIVEWMRVGFIHGVMNTDNMALSGETIDYGPCAFLDEYHPNKVFSSIDRYGRYSFSNQPNIFLWNLAQLARCLSLLIDPVHEKGLEAVNELLLEFEQIFALKYLKMMGQKIGIIHSTEQDRILIDELLTLMQKESVDFTLMFRYLSYIAKNGQWPFKSVFFLPPALELWVGKWQARLKMQNIPREEIAKQMFALNPAFVPRNHQIEKLIQSILEKQDYSKMENFIKILSSPYKKEQQEDLEYLRPPHKQERVCQTYCGT